MPTQPSDLPPWASFVELANAYGAHVGWLGGARHRIGVVLTREQLAAHAVAALACQQALAERILHDRWMNARDALTHGAALRQVATAMAITELEVRAGLTNWADGRARDGLMTDSEVDEVLRLIGGRVPIL